MAGRGRSRSWRPLARYASGLARASSFGRGGFLRVRNLRVDVPDAARREGDKSSVDKDAKLVEALVLAAPDGDSEAGICEVERHPIPPASRLARKGRSRFWG